MDEDDRSSGLSAEPTGKSSNEESSNEESSDDDKREDERITINKEFESFDAFIHEYVTNISRTGVFVKSKEPLSVGTRVNLRFTVIMDDIETIEGIGKVVRVAHDPPGMGVVFTHLSQYSKHLIDRLLTAQPDGSSD